LTTVSRALLLLVAGCGRIGFGALGTRDDATAVAVADARGLDAFGPCPVSRTAPDPIVMSGDTRDSLDVTVTDVTVAASNAVDGTPIATTTSNASGTYSLPIPTGGVPIAPVLTVSATGYVSAFYTLSFAFAANFQLDPIVFSSSDIAYIYAQSAQPQMGSDGVLEVGLVDCSLTPISGAVITTTPPLRIVYVNAAGAADGSLSATTTSGVGFAVNAPPGQIQVSVTLAGSTFMPREAQVEASPILSGIAMTPLP
jgi:hypothetical protein